jgi:hypothetical protein
MIEPKRPNPTEPEGGLNPVQAFVVWIAFSAAIIAIVVVYVLDR